MIGLTLEGFIEAVKQDMYVGNSEHRFVTDLQISKWDDKYTKTEVNNKISAIITGMDWKQSVDTFNDIAKFYPNPSNGWVVNVKNTDITYRYNGESWIPISANFIPLASKVVDGLMLSTDKAKLDSISPNANNYIHPSTHPAFMIVEDTAHNFITKSERDKLALLSSYVHPLTHPASIIIQDSTHKFVTDIQITSWNDKYTKGEIDNKISTFITGMDWKQAVNTFNDIAKVYPNPIDGWTVNVKDTNITYRYNGNAWIAVSTNSIPLATQAIDGKMSAADKTKLDGIAPNANNYIHPINHHASMIVTDENNRFVSDMEKLDWNDKYTQNEVDAKISQAIEIFDSTGGVDVVFGNTKPTRTNSLWVDNTAQDNVWEDDSVVAEIRSQITEFGEVVDRLAYVVDYELDAGYFKDLLPGTEVEQNGSVKHIIVKRGYKKDIEQLQTGEMGFCIDTEELYIGNKNMLKLIAKVGGVGGSDNGNVTAEYVELVSSNGSKYRLIVNDDGQPLLLNATSDTATAPIPSDSGRFAGLFINKVYGGGTIDSNTTPVSHSFIELYNSTDNTINLKGLAIQYGEYAISWKIFPLRGEIKPYSSFLIRGARHSDPYRQTTRFKILDFDMSIPDLVISPNGFKVYLNIPADITKPTTYLNPANTDSNWTKEVGYINLFAAGGEDAARIIDAFESTTSGSGSSYGQIVNKYRMIKRRYSEATTSVFANTGSSFDDLEYLDMREADIEIYSPRPQRFGQWNYFYNQLPLDQLIPNNVNICFGKDGDTSRTFTWQTPPTEHGYLKYKIKGTNDWTTLPSKKTFVALMETDVIIHSVIAQNLTPNTYVYKVGSEGRWSDEYELIVANATPTNRTMRLLHISDQQGWDRFEYKAWEKANAFIEKTEASRGGYDFIINTGDISQNANRPFEWRYYYYYAKQNLGSHVHMTCIGNNDLIDKKDPTAFTYYSTVESCFNINGTITNESSVVTNVTNASIIAKVGELVTGTGIPFGTNIIAVSDTTITLSKNATFSGTVNLSITPISKYPSVYSYNYGYCHFICLNSNPVDWTDNSVTPAKTYVGNDIVNLQLEFIRRDMAISENRKRWTIVYMHESPYTIVSSAKLRPFINVFNEVGVDLVLCGHHHCYSRSNRMGAIPTLLHFNGNIKDESLKTWTASGGAATSTAKFKFGTASLLLDGVDDYIKTSKCGDFDLGTLDFTIDFQLNCGVQTKNSPTILSNGVTTLGNDSIYIGIDETGKIVFKYGSTENLISITNVTDSIWHHIAITRSKDTLRLFIDGALQSSATFSEAIDFSLNGTIIGKSGWDNVGSYLSGNIDEFRVQKGIADWTAAFTSPTAAHSKVDIVVPNTVNGTYYIMSQATGFKNSGKQVPTQGALWPALIDRQGDPCYIMFEVSYNQIISKPYRLTKILPMIDNMNNEVEAVAFDEFIITKP